MTRIVISFAGCLALWVLVVAFVLLPLMSAAKRADENLEALKAQEDYRDALRRACQRMRAF